MKSYLFVPGRPKMLAKIAASEADACIIDLEDSIAEADKEQALADVCAFLAAPPEKTLYVRLDGRRLKEQLARLSGLSFRGVMIPKFEDPEAYAACEPLLRGYEVLALVETPLGIVRLREIAMSPLVSGIAFGAEDFASSVGMLKREDTLYYARSAIVTHGKAFGKPVIDTPSFILEDMEALGREIEAAAAMGFDGKLAIHPRQVPRIRAYCLYGDLGRLREIVDRYEAAGEAVLRLDGQVYEKMHIARFRKVLEENGLI